ncbi:hypothetical protein SDC9_51380 [bioreactor metagenome]|uniref:Uncharacterized protein n=1 Tax=bioreactor metagenome TaxID=1076179 RepID=A0A644WMF3_9ZZZZ
MIDIVYRNTTQYSFIQGRNHFLVIFHFCRYQTTQGSAVIFGDNHILRHVNQTTGKVTGISRFQSRIRQTFTGTVGRDKVLQYRQTFFKVRQNRVFNNLTAFGA